MQLRLARSAEDGKLPPPAVDESEIRREDRVHNIRKYLNGAEHQEDQDKARSTPSSQLRFFPNPANTGMLKLVPE